MISPSAARGAEFEYQQDSGSGEWGDEGEELAEVDERRREALSLDARRGRNSGAGGTEGRLSRELEEGFKDDSDEDEESDEVLRNLRRMGIL